MSHSNAGPSTEPKPNGESIDDESQEKVSPLTTGPDVPKLEKRWIEDVELPSFIAWIPGKLNWSNLKPVLRSAVAAWIALIMILVPPVENILGQAGFLVLVAAFLSPPNEPLAAIVERETFILLCVVLAWAWSCLGIFLASLGRTHSLSNTDANPTDIFSGVYIEAVPAVVCAIFLGFGSAFFLYLKARLGPGPYVFGTVFGCICLDISLTTAPLFPYPYYLVGETISIPLAIHSAISLACSLLVFPETVNAQFIKRLRAVLVPLTDGIKTQVPLLAKSPLSEEFDPEPFLKDVANAEAALVPVAASSRLMKRDISWGRLSGEQLRELHDKIRRLTVRATGLSYFFTILETRRKPFPGSRTLTPSTTIHASSPSTPTPSSAMDLPLATAALSKGKHSHHERHHRRSRSSHHHVRHQASESHHHHSFFHDALEQSSERAIGVFESCRYMNMEASLLSHPRGGHYTEQALALLSECSTELLKASAEGMEHVGDWLDGMNTYRFERFLGRRRVVSWKEKIKKNREIVEKLESALDMFRKEKRLAVLNPYRPYFDNNRHTADGTPSLPPHRYLFQSYLYIYHLTRFNVLLLDILNEIERLDKDPDTQQSRIWSPVLPLSTLIFGTTGAAHEANEGTEKADDENPDVIPGNQTQGLGDTKARDPDALPPTNPLQYLGTWIYDLFQSVTKGNALFAVKAGVLTVLLALPSYTQTSAGFAYRNRAVWAVIMGQLTLARFRGDTIFALFARVLSTFIGGVIGITLWYMSSGLGPGSPYGLAAVGLVFFPVMMFFRIYYPGPPMTVLVLFVTVVLVLGYSWQDTHIYLVGSPGVGWEVGWQRFVLVVIGVTGAFIFSLLPPTWNIREYTRRTYSHTCSELGSIYCSVISYANTHGAEERPDASLIKNLIAIRSKLTRTTALRANVGYEVSLRGKWPTERYDEILEIQLELAYLLSHLTAVSADLNPIWSRAFLRRTRFVETMFLGDVLAVISMCSSALRTGQPLPQITPSPLLDRFWIKGHPGLSVFQKGQEVEDEYHALPQRITMDTLEDEQYLMFSVGVSCAYGIVTRLDRLMVATKALVGEQYHIEGVGLDPSAARPLHDA